eukprot:Skav204527  [mRNA]  locus=scaffold4461:182765:190363:- [translate_table: standard]
MGGEPTRLIVVDDESDGSKDWTCRDGRPDLCALASEGYAVRIHCRKKEEARAAMCWNLLGFGLAKYATLLCRVPRAVDEWSAQPTLPSYPAALIQGMDADLQHEPESVPDVAQPVLEGDQRMRKFQQAIGMKGGTLQ